MKKNFSHDALEAASVSTPLGPFQLALNQGRLTSLFFGDKSVLAHWAQERGLSLKWISQAPSPLIKEIELYFQGQLKKFTYPTVPPIGTLFEKKVWDALKEIPYGEVKSYKWLAQKIGTPKAVRAVGQANGKNPLPIVIPCHRVISSSGGLGGYSGGLDIKRKLLELEGIKM